MSAATNSQPGYQIKEITDPLLASKLSKFSAAIAKTAYRQLAEETAAGETPGGGQSQAALITQDYIDTNLSRQHWLRRIDRGDRTVFAALFANTLVGVVYAAQADNGPHNTDSYIGGLYVGAPGQGIASVLLNHAELQLAAWGRQKVLSEVAENSPARDLFQLRGYQVLGSHPGRNFHASNWLELRRNLVAAVSL